MQEGRFPYATVELITDRGEDKRRNSEVDIRSHIYIPRTRRGEAKEKQSSEANFEN